MKLKTFTKVGAIAAVAFGLSSAAQAAFITGTFGFTGFTQLSGLSTPSAALQTATGISVITGSVIPGSATGNFTPASGASVVFAAPWLWGGTPAFLSSGTLYNATSVPINNFWTIDYNGGGNDFSFKLTGAQIRYDNSPVPTLNIFGTGIVSGTGFQDTVGTWNFSTQQPSSGTPNFIFTWSASGDATGRGVPDGGTTVALLGLSLLGLHGVRRKFAKR